MKRKENRKEKEKGKIYNTITHTYTVTDTQEKNLFFFPTKFCGDDVNNEQSTESKFKTLVYWQTWMLVFVYYQYFIQLGSRKERRVISDYMVDEKLQKKKENKKNVGPFINKQLLARVYLKTVKFPFIFLSDEECR